MKHLLRGAALVALVAIFAPALAQSPDTAAPASNGPAPAVQEKAAAHDAGSGNWVQPRPKRHVRRSHRYAYARPHSPPYGSPYYWDHRWASPADHAANDLNAHIAYGNGWGWGGWGPYSRMPYTSY